MQEADSQAVRSVAAAKFRAVQLREGVDDCVAKGVEMGGEGGGGSGDEGGTSEVGL